MTCRPMSFEPFKVLQQNEDIIHPCTCTDQESLDTIYGRWMRDCGLVVVVVGGGGGSRTRLVRFANQSDLPHSTKTFATTHLNT